MGLDFGVLTKSVVVEFYGRPITVTPAGGAPYNSRGIWHRDSNDFPGEDGSLVTDHKVSIDVLDSDFAVVPRQGDLIEVPADGTVPAEGAFTVLSAHGDGGGMTNLVLSEYLTTVPSPNPPPLQRQRGKV
jgi:hypothetical protein